ncbi:MAG TPA: hypothetical protein ENJ09_07500 [Planctomycetes bacterium]|nr:hypothetical protein [Planctomycetota bacterium]
MTTQPFEPSDAEVFAPGFGKGGVPWLLLIFYLSYLTFFTWYVTSFQLPDFLTQAPVGSEEVAQ